MNILDQLLQELNYGFSGPPQPGDAVVQMETGGGTGPRVAAYEARLEAEAG